MLLSVAQATIVVPSLSFVFVVPGQQRWTLRSVRANCTRDVGGSPNRAYTLSITDGTTVVAAIGADDAGTEPGTGEITWAPAPAAHVAVAGAGVTLAPLPPFVLNPGYVITGAILGAAPADTWVSAAVWYDFAYTAT